MSKSFDDAKKEVLAAVRGSPLQGWDTAREFQAFQSALEGMTLEDYKNRRGLLSRVSGTFKPTPESGAASLIAKAMSGKDISDDDISAAMPPVKKEKEYSAADIMKNKGGRKKTRARRSRKTARKTRRRA